MTGLLGCCSSSTLGSRANDYVKTLTTLGFWLHHSPCSRGCWTNNTRASRSLSPKYDIKNNEKHVLWAQRIVFKITTRRSTIDVRKKSDLSRKNRTTGSPGHVRKIWDWLQPVHGLMFPLDHEKVPGFMPFVGLSEPLDQDFMSNDNAINTSVGSQMILTTVLYLRPERQRRTASLTTNRPQAIYL